MLIGVNSCTTKLCALPDTRQASLADDEKSDEAVVTHSQMDSKHGIMV